MGSTKIVLASTGEWLENHFAVEDSVFEYVKLVYLPERKIPLYFVNRGLGG